MSEHPEDRTSLSPRLPAQTARDDIILLCSAYTDLSLRGMTINPQTPPPFLKAREVTLTHIENEIISLLPCLGPDGFGTQFFRLAEAQSDRIHDAARALGLFPKPFHLHIGIYDWLDRGPEAFMRLIRAGLLPPTEEDKLQNVVDLILENSTDPEAGAPWRHVLESWCSAGNMLASEILTHVRERCQALPEHLHAFCARLLEAQVRTHPVGATGMLRGAIIGSCSFDAVALLLAGAQLPQDRKKLGGGPKVHAIAEFASTSHGRLALFKSLGPLEAWFDLARRGHHPVLDTARNTHRKLPA